MAVFGETGQTTHSTLVKIMVSECKYVNFDEKRNTKCLKAIENEDSVR